MAKSLLIVDDSATMRRIIMRTVRMSGLEFERTEEAGNGVEAVLLSRILVACWLSVAGQMQYWYCILPRTSVTQTPFALDFIVSFGIRLRRLLTLCFSAFWPRFAVSVPAFFVPDVPKIESPDDVRDSLPIHA